MWPFELLNTRSDFDEAIMLMKQKKYNEAKSLFSTVSAKDKDYPRAKYNLFCLCCSGFLDGKFYIDEGIKHLKEAYTCGHIQAKAFYTIIDYAMKGDCGLSPIEMIIKNRHQSNEVNLFAKAGCPDPILTALLCSWCYYYCKNKDIIHNVIDYLNMMDFYLHGIIEDIKEDMNNEIPDSYFSHVFMKFIYNPLAHSNDEFNPNLNPEFGTNKPIINFVYSLYLALMKILSITKSDKIVMIYFYVVREYCNTKILNQMEECLFTISSLIKNLDESN